MKPIEFWVAVFIAILVKVRTSERLSFWQVCLTITIALGSAYVAADFVSTRLGISEAISAALVALTAEGIMRWLIIASSDPLKALKEFRK